MDRNDSGALYAGGGVVIVVVLVACLKTIKALFIELGKTFDALALMAQSLIALLYQFAIDIGLIACAVAAIYFTYRYVKMVKQATALREEVDRKLSQFDFDFRSTLESSLSECQKSVSAQVLRMEYQLREALKEPEVAPTPVAIIAASPASDALPESQSAVKPNAPATVESNEVTDLSAISNPY